LSRLALLYNNHERQTLSVHDYCAYAKGLASYNEKIMSINLEDQALVRLNNTHLNYQKRELAIHYIFEHPTPQGIKALVNVLSDQEFGVR
jgi:hypothetical protein